MSFVVDRAIANFAFGCTYSTNMLFSCALLCLKFRTMSRLKVEPKEKRLGCQVRTSIDKLSRNYICLTLKRLLFDVIPLFMLAIAAIARKVRA